MGGTRMRASKGVVPFKRTLSGPLFAGAGGPRYRLVASGTKYPLWNPRAGTRMRTITILAILMSAAVAAGCAGNNTTTTSTSTTTTTSTPTTTTTIPPTVTTPNVTAPTLGAVTAIALKGVPANATANTSVTVCWTVNGTGNVKHLAVHFDNASHTASNTTFNDYKGGAAYPNNATALDPAGYNLPGTFCSNVPVGDGVYLRAHVIDVTGGDGRLSDEKEIEANTTS
jgi:hypothetical protein